MEVKAFSTDPGQISRFSHLRVRCPWLLAVTLLLLIVACSGPTPTYYIGLHIYLCADDDGSQGPDLLPVDVEQAVTEANRTYLSAGIQFLFDPVTDLEYLNNTLVNREFKMPYPVDLADYTDRNVKPPLDSESPHRARTELAEQYRDRVVVFFRKTETLSFSDDLGHWIVANRGGSSGWSAPYVNLHHFSPGKDDMSHELGHYFQNRHPHPGGVTTYAAAVSRVQNYIKTHPVSEGLDALNADRYFVTDTPPDASDAIYRDLGRDPCAADGTIELLVPDPFDPAVEHSYVLDPHRNNILSYYGRCPWPMWLTLDQTARARDGLENGTRHRLISARLENYSGPIELQGLTDAGVHSDIHLIRVRQRQLVTGLIASNGRAKLIAWDVDDDGQLTRRGAIETYGPAGRIELTNMGLGLIATAVRTEDGLLKIIIYQVDEEGSFVRRGDLQYAAEISDIGIARIGPEYFVVGVRIGSSLRMLAFSVDLPGNVNLLAEANGGSHSFLSLAPVGRGMGVAAAFRNESGFLELITWKLEKNEQRVWELNRTEEALAGKTTYVSALGLDIDRLATAVRTSAGDLKLILWRVDEEGTLTRAGDDERTQGAVITQAARLGVDAIGTASVTSLDNRLGVEIWETSSDGQQVDLRLNLVLPLTVTDAAATQVDWGKLAVAATDQNGLLRLMVFQVPGLVTP